MPRLSEMERGSELPGIIVRGYGLYYDVATGAGLLRCTLRGALKRARRGTDPAAVGDRVRATLTTPEGPANALTLPSSRARRSSSPAPVRTLVSTIG